MIQKGIGVFTALTLLSAAAHAGSPPKELYGKSIIVSWTEQHNQRFTGDANYRNVLVPLSNSIYISATGRVFTRTIVGTWAPHEAVGTGGTSPGGGPRQIQFSARTMTWTGASTGGVGRRITIDFNEGFTTCQAHESMSKA
jgi:hypothetical protein